MDRKIPKILHQVWLGKQPIPEIFIEWKNHWRVLHPDWQYKLWTDRDISKNTQLITFTSSSQQFSSKSNIVRLYAIMKYGGVYCDMDFEWNKNIDDFLVYEAFSCKETPNLYCNAIFGAIKQHEWVIYQYENLHKYYMLPPPWGPTLMTEAIQEIGQNVVTIPTNFFYPYLYNNSYVAAKEFPDSYAVHHWNCSWRKTIDFKSEIEQYNRNKKNEF